MASGFTDFFALNGCSSSPQSCAPPPSPILQLVTLLHIFPPVFRHRTPTGLRPREFLPLLEYLTLTGDSIFDDGFDGTQNPVPRSTSPPLTGSLGVLLEEGITSTVLQLLGLLSGFHFRAIKLSPSGEEELHW